MKALEERILRDGQIRPGNILKVDSFLNHQIDIAFMNEMGKEFRRVFADKHVTKILTTDDRVLIIDDFLANGYAARGLIDLVEQAGAVLESVGIVIEKGFQDGGMELRESGVDVRSLAIIESMSDNNLVFRDQD